MGEIDNFAASVAEHVPAIAARVPPAPAAELGRLDRPAALAPPTAPFGASAGFADPMPVRGHPGQALRGLPAERLLGALELSVGDLPLRAPAALLRGIAAPPTGTFTTIGVVGQSELTTALSMLEALHAGATRVIADLTARLARHPALATALAVGDGDEATIAARHGAGHFALAVVTSSAVLRALDAADPPAVVGAALQAVAQLMPTLPKPAAYEAALLAKHRAEYMLPRRASAHPLVRAHHLALADGPVPDEVDFSDNGLVAVVDGGVVIRTGLAEGRVSAHLEVLDGPPPPPEVAHVDEAVEVSWRAARGGATFAEDEPVSWGQARRVAETPPWPGDYRVLVQAGGRDGDYDEHYWITVWQAPWAPPVVHKRTDRLGHRLRGEPEPPLVVPPHQDHVWVERHPISQASCVTVVTGLSAQEVLRAFGADPTSRPWRLEETQRSADLRQWVSVLQVDGAVIAFEDNGYLGADEEVLRRLSARGRAASMFWNVNALTRLSFARDGELLAGFEPIGPAQIPPAAAVWIEGLDLADYRHRKAKGLTAVARFTGRGFTPDDLAALRAADEAYLVGE
ncbi:DUF6461 domain-containing protein [Saccharothrix coeruleofusca]|uniref:Uncharacterized protein n=1 Tax=Saccharothrix coeruleofusca TaxID=33919 RepID=A0A918EEB2_9PSEU|nr:DUF6461 domain-containing protein [Saccharothrix coeruleofusca]GGP51067.1 hypothetical protein GCM10010185_24380 [Saccharothrix coeruleofusca]